MARKCKCKNCRTSLTTDIAYKVKEGDKNVYYCSKEEYDTVIKEKEDKNRCITLLCDVMRIPFAPPILIKEVNNLKQYYEYEVIIRAIKENGKTLNWFISNNADSSDYAKTRYIITVISNNINAIKKKYDKEQKEIERLFSKNDSVSDIQVDIINNINKNNNSRVTDISDFLD